MSSEEVRAQLGMYLTKPIQLSTGAISTQQNLSASSLGTGGLDGEFYIKKNGVIIVNDGTNDRVLIGKIG